MYLPNNPIYQRATENLRAAFSPIWAVLDELVLNVAETDFVWEEQVVYHQLNKSESLAWGLFKDGMRSLTIRRGAEQEELPRFLETDQPGALPPDRCRRRPADAALGAGVPATSSTTSSSSSARAAARCRSRPAPTRPGGDDGRRAAAPGAGGRGRPAQAQGRGGPGGLRLHALLPRRVRDPPGRERSRERVPPRRPHRPRSTSSSTSSSSRATRRSADRDPRHPRPPLPQSPQRPRLPDGGAVLRETKLLAARGKGLAPAELARLDAFVAKLSEPAIVSPAAAVAGRDALPRRRGGSGGRAARASGYGARAGAERDPRARVAGAQDAARGRGRPAGDRPTPTRCSASSARRLAGAGVGGRALRPPRPASGRAGTGEHRHPRRSRRAARLGAGAGPARHPGRARAGGQGDRGRRPRRAARRGAGGRLAGLQGRAQAGGVGRAGEEREGDGSHREDGVLRSLRHHRGRRRPEGAERHAAAARAAQAQGVVRDPGLRGDRDRQDPHGRGPRDPQRRWRTTRTSWCATR